MTDTKPDVISLTDLKGTVGSRHSKKRIGLGGGSGHGQTSTRGQKGQRGRSGDGKLVGFEGGQTPLLRRLPKRGFKNTAFRKVYQIVSLANIARVFKSQEEVSVETMVLHGLVRRKGPVKVLSSGAVQGAYRISAHAFSKQAAEEIKKAGGTALVVSFYAKGEGAAAAVAQRVKPEAKA